MRLAGKTRVGELQDLPVPADRWDQHPADANGQQDARISNQLIWVVHLNSDLGATKIQTN